VHRFGGGIAQLATAIRLGDDDATIDLLRSEPEGVRWIDADAGDESAIEPVRERALDWAQALLAAARAQDAAAALATLRAFRILCAHRRGPYGVASWTSRIEGWLQSAADGPPPGDRWFVGRPLLVTENDYELGLNNGDTGIVVRRGERPVAVFDRGSGHAEFSPSRLGAIQTVYAMTIHKSQGSQFDAAAVLLPQLDSRILTRELLYTAATRAQSQLTVVGSEQTIRAAVRRPVARASGLRAKLWGPDA
jgi:exodeoxyribonuclease V alpha subunit